MDSPVEVIEEHDHTRSRGSRNVDLSRVMQASKALRTQLSPPARYDQRAKSPMINCYQACSFPKSLHPIDTSTDFVFVGPRPDCNAEDTAWWDEAPLSNTIELADTIFEPEDDYGPYEDNAIPLDTSDTEGFWQYEALTQDFSPRPSVHSPKPSPARRQLAHGFVTPSKKAVRSAAPASDHPSPTPMIGYETVTSIATTCVSGYSSERENLDGTDLVEIYDSDGDVVLKSRLWEPRKALDVGPLLFPACDGYDLPWNSALEDVNSTKHLPSIKVSPAQTPPSDISELGRLLQRSAPRIALQYGNNLRPPWDRIELSEMPFTTNFAPTLIHHAPETRYLTRRPFYWDLELLNDVTAWVEQPDTLVSSMDIQAIWLEADPSLTRLSDDHVGAIYARKDENASSIVLTHLYLPPRARNLLNSHVELEWFVFHIEWATGINFQPLATTIALPRSHATHIATNRVSLGIHGASELQNDGTYHFKSAFPAYRFLLMDYGPSPVACGSGLDEWALQDFMTACARGDGMITISL